jgi:hypothetical protein
MWAQMNMYYSKTGCKIWESDSGVESPLFQHRELDSESGVGL